MFYGSQTISSVQVRCYIVDILEQLIRRMMTMSVKKGGKEMLGKNKTLFETGKKGK